MCQTLHPIANELQQLIRRFHETLVLICANFKLFVSMAAQSIMKGGQGVRWERTASEMCAIVGVGFICLHDHFIKANRQVTCSSRSSYSQRVLRVQGYNGGGCSGRPEKNQECHWSSKGRDGAH